MRCKLLVQIVCIVSCFMYLCLFVGQVRAGETDQENVFKAIEITCRESKLNTNQGVLIIKNKKDIPISPVVTFRDSDGHILASCNKFTIDPNGFHEYGLLQCWRNFKEDEKIDIEIEGEKEELYSYIYNNHITIATSWGEKKAFQSMDLIKKIMK